MPTLNEIQQADTVQEILKLMVSPKTSGIVPLPLHVDRIALGVADTAGGIFAWQNPLDVKVLATAIVNVTTKSTAACTIDVGEVANATSSGDTILDGLDVGTATIVGNAFKHLGTNGTGFRLVDEKAGASDFVTGSKATGAAAGLAGFAYILYFPVS